MKIRWPYNYLLLFMVSIIAACFITAFLLEYRLFIVFFAFAMISEGFLTFLVVAFFLKVGLFLGGRGTK